MAPASSFLSNLFVLFFCFPMEIIKARVKLGSQRRIEETDSKVKIRARRRGSVENSSRRRGHFKRRTWKSDVICGSNQIFLNLSSMIDFSPSLRPREVATEDMDHLFAAESVIVCGYIEYATTFAFHLFMSSLHHHCSPCIPDLQSSTNWLGLRGSRFQCRKRHDSNQLFLGWCCLQLSFVSYSSRKTRMCLHEFFYRTWWVVENYFETQNSIYGFWDYHIYEVFRNFIEIAPLYFSGNLRSWWCCFQVQIQLCGALL